MSRNENPCEGAELVRDYAFDELGPAERKSMEHHLTACSGCASELDRLRLTTAVLRVLPDVEVPRRISFVSDKAVEQGWWSGFWNSSARLGFASACVLAVGLSFAAYHRSADPAPAVQTAGVSQADIDRAVTKAVALAVERAHADDAQLMKTALDAVDNKYAQKQQDLMLAAAANLEYLQKSYVKTARASFTDIPIGARQ